MRLRLSKAAARDVEEAWEYGARQWSPEHADALLDELEKKFRLMTRFPEAGRTRDELSPALRSLATSGFVILYRVCKQVLEVVRVIHGSRDLQGLLSEENPGEGGAE